jgi:hypothetical protein
MRLCCDRSKGERSFQVIADFSSNLSHDSVLGTGGSPNLEGGSFDELLALLEGWDTRLGEGSNEKQPHAQIETSR